MARLRTTLGKLFTLMCLDVDSLRSPHPPGVDVRDRMISQQRVVHIPRTASGTPHDINFPSICLSQLAAPPLDPSLYDVSRASRSALASYRKVTTCRSCAVHAGCVLYLRTICVCRRRAAVGGPDHFSKADYDPASRPQGRVLGA